jgi:diguanylate cyclase (GGDEF)-like protein/PAS domain S-box-containing protein
MKRFLPHLTPAARISIGLISLIVTLLLVIDLALNLVPDRTDMERQIRESTSERLAVQITTLIQAQEWDALKLTMREAMARDKGKEILSLAVRQSDGKIVVSAGDHLHNWVPPAAGKSTLTHVRVPVMNQNAHWGDVEISYAPVTPQSLLEWLRTPLVALALIVVPVGFLAFYLYMRRSLQYLDPSAAIPDRVRAAFDALTEGVAIIDNTGRIMLYNKSFQQLHPFAETDMLGKFLSQIPWLIDSGKGPETPWDYALQHQAHFSEQLYTIPQADHTSVEVVVNASPIQDARGKMRGCMVTFYDVTELHRANETMRSALDALEASREQIEKKNKDLQYLATHDSLTGCLNRRAFFEEAEVLFAKLKEEARDVSCIMADIDFFKKVNDTYGHLVGDQVIVAVTRTLTKRMRNSDLLCRMGGEEFCIMLPGASEETALDVAERLRSEIEQWVGDEVGAVTGLKITSSFGVTSLKSGAESVSELVELADFALYTSKQAGRNQVTLWSDHLMPRDGKPSPSGLFASQRG